MVLLFLEMCVMFTFQRKKMVCKVKCKSRSTSLIRILAKREVGCKCFDTYDRLRARASQGKIFCYQIS